MKKFFASVATFIAIAALATLALTGCDRSDASGQLTLKIISPHGTDIRQEFADAFSKWHQQHYGQSVIIEWRDIASGGTNNIVTYISKFREAHTSPDIDILFGGGSDTFVTFAGKGWLHALPPVVPADPPEWQSHDPLQQIPPDIFDAPLHGKDDVWIAATMSEFGFAINKDRIAELHLQTPRRWEDLAAPEWFGLLSLADPAKSGSVKTSYEMIFQEYGWERGWAIITELFANAAMVRDGGSNPADDVASAEAVGGIVIDFFGRKYVARAGPRIMAFVAPEAATQPGEAPRRATSIDADPIAMLDGAPSPELAARFIRFVISPEGQRLWTYRPGLPNGPRRNALGRLAVLPSIYTAEAANLIDPANPFTGNRPRAMNAADRNARGIFIGDLIKAALIDNQEQLAVARKKIHDHGDPADQLAALTAPPTFLATTVNDKGELQYAEASLTHQAQADAAAAYAPSKPPLSAYKDSIQTKQRDQWRQQFEGRFEALAR